MTLQEFITKYNGNYVDNDGAYGAQCMDLMHFYVREVLELDSSQLRAATAYKSFQKGGEDFYKHNYSSGMTPKAGDVIYWSDKYVDGTGHVAIVVEATPDKFVSFDQNWPVGSPCHTVEHSYDGVIGWLRSKHNKNNDKVMIKLLENHELVWLKNPGDTTAEFWVLRDNKEHPLKTRHKVDGGLQATVNLFASYGKYRRVEWPEIAGLTEKKVFNLRNKQLTKPELFEAS